MWKSINRLGMVLGAVIIAAGGNTKPATAQNTLDASVGFYPGALVSLPAFVAKEQKFFEKRGLNVELVPIATGPAMTSAVASGSVTFVNNSWDNLIVAVENGLPVRGVVGSTMKMPFGFIVRKGVAMPHMKDGYPAVIQDLKGLNWGVLALGVSIQYISQKLLTDAGYKANDVTFLAVGLPNTARPALQRGIVDTYLSVEPLPSIVAAKEEGTVAIDLAQNQGPAFFRDLGYNGWWASTSTIQGNPEIVSRFVGAMQDAFCWYNKPANFEQVVALLKRNVPVPDLSEDQYKAMAMRLLPIYGPDITSRTIDSWSSLLLEQKQIKSPRKRSEVIAAVAGPEALSCAR
ncbi:ABC transporter substrate-binding protein [Agrobacterium sp. a22-2]|uniref:ABC transporter substrate-binding protein n=1 Tax=Agrobacterium sp. a22-2 TaxID=2283840 RepID=UPI0014459E92|nr:ABC transporter substrate-binding protein [Agrobacterium sp. a22-2]NKN39784.1 ABC transporter substrate-binding protein [Agrobacterium sp. a22-2]